MATVCYQVEVTIEIYDGGGSGFGSPKYSVKDLSKHSTYEDALKAVESYFDQYIRLSDDPKLKPSKISMEEKRLRQ